MTTPNPGPVECTCGACSRCFRAAAVARNLALYGQDDYPGAVEAARIRAARGAAR